MAPPFDQIFPPSPSFTEKLAEDQDGRVVLVTGSTSADKISATIKTTKSQVSTKIGRVEALQLDPANLASIGQSAREFLTKGNRLDVFVHNAGLMKPPAGSKTDLVSVPSTTMRSFTDNLLNAHIWTSTDGAMVET